MTSLVPIQMRPAQVLLQCLSPLLTIFVVLNFQSFVILESAKIGSPWDDHILFLSSYALLIQH